ncbi:SepM family pheromone-processing serine protease [Aneurinibacillus terranovensis]|uniref:SepM family pheromone-processing serine protease n=1 Tax=Aneurinibacillus terranovensis TaxID=278991 RepID=UPI000402521D|nr:SepM family pheromone-processing serine protease [Aneurinibacillus terranovensis]
MKEQHRRPRFLNNWSAFLLAVILAVALAAVAFIPTSYYVIRPGSAIALQPMVTVEGGEKREKGVLMLTTVRMGPTTVLTYLLAKADPYADLMNVRDIHSPNETDQQYERQQLEVMKDSQEKAEIVAFKKAGVLFKVKNEGAMVMETIPGMPAEKIFKVADDIIAVDGQPVTTAQELLKALQGRKIGETVKIEFLRDNQSRSVTVALQKLPTAPGQPARAGLGIYAPATKRTVELSRKVTIHSDQIGGPSAGMMFTLEILNQLQKTDLTKGYRIAGTGEIFEDGTVGRIGGIQHKVQASDKEKADIFFAPNDIVPPGSGLLPNYVEAKQAADKLKTKMKIVPVRTIDDALRYLHSLPPKTNG